MGLNIDGKNLDQEIHMNWSKVGNFIEWCKKNNLSTPLIGWDGTNNPICYKISEDKNFEKEAKLWIKEFTKFLNNKINKKEVDYYLMFCFQYYLFLANQLEGDGFVQYS